MAEKKAYRVAMLGTGFIADWHMKALRSIREARVTAVCDLNVDRAASFAGKYKIPGAYGSLRELLDKKEHDVVHVLVPAEAHYRAAREVLDAGVNVLVEKPMCLTAEECAALQEVAEYKGVQAAVSHNFMFAANYEALRADLKRGALGRIDRVDVNWSKELGQVANGPFDGWMLREPENVILEIGPHSVGQLIDLVGPPDEMHVRATNPVDLPTGKRFYRRWRVEAYRGDVAANLNFSFAAGFTEHSIHVRGSLASATVDFDRDTYVLHRHVAQDYDFDRYAMTAREAASLRKQARAALIKVATSKATRSPKGNPFGASIAGSVRTFYEGLETGLDSRLSAKTGRDVVSTCIKIGTLAHLPKSSSEAIPTPVGAVTDLGDKPTILVLGATGFIGKELVRQLAEQGKAVRVLVRRTGGVAAHFDRRHVEVMQGDLSRPEDMDRALDGITHVCHLARAQAKTYSDFLKHDVEVTRVLAEKCLALGVKRLLYTSSISPYYSGKKAGRITEDTPLDPKIDRRNPYARIKAASESMLNAMRREQGLPVVIFRPGIVIGRGSRPFHPGVGLWAWDSICRFWGEGRNPLPIVLVEDVASAMVAALDKEGIEGETFNLVGDPCLNARDFIHEIESHAGIRIDAAPAPISRFYLAEMGRWLVKVLVRHPERKMPSYRDWDSRSQRAIYDCSKAKRILNWRPAADRDEVVRRGIQEPLSELLR